jgi:hypothetical protein
MFSEFLGGVPDNTDNTLVVTEHFRLIRKQFTMKTIKTFTGL